ncbi:MAG: YbaN family protein [Planctomycetota bacterium]
MHRQALRLLLLLAGFVFLGLAVIGTILPIMPTVPFLLLAIACFSRSSESMHQWILDWPVLGNELRVWEEQGAISIRAKVWTGVVMIGLVAIPMFFRSIAILWKVAALVVTIGVLGFVWSRPPPADPGPADDD